jgi:hypothetical protein
MGYYLEVQGSNLVKTSMWSMVYIDLYSQVQGSNLGENFHVVNGVC